MGKSTLLSKITGMFGLLNTSNNRETSCLWRYILRNNSNGIYEIREVSKKNVNITSHQYKSREELVKGVKTYSGKSLVGIDEI